VCKSEAAFPDLESVKAAELDGVELEFLDFVERSNEDGEFLVVKGKRLNGDNKGPFTFCLSGVPMRKLKECKAKDAWPVIGKLMKVQSKENKARQYWDIL